MQIICYAMDLDEAHLPGRQVAQTALISPKKLTKAAVICQRASIRLHPSGPCRHSGV